MNLNERDSSVTDLRLFSNMAIVYRIRKGVGDVHGMRIVNSIQNEYSKSKLFFTLKSLTTIIATYFALRVIFVSVSGLINDKPIPDNMDLLLFGLLFFLGLSNAVQLVEMVIYKKKESFKLLLVTTIFVFGVSFYILLL